MYLKNPLFVTILASFALVVACGGAEEIHDAISTASKASGAWPRSG